MGIRQALIRQALVIVAVMVVGVTVVATSMLGLEQSQEARAKQALPTWTRWESRLFQVDLDDDGALETVSLEDKTLFVTDGHAASWSDTVPAQLPEGRYTSQVLVQDIDFDGTQEIVTLTWKKGSFGPSHPFWHTEADDKMTEHVFIFTYEDGALKEKWLSSDIRMEVVDLNVDPLGRLQATLLDGTKETLEWQGWGLTYLDDATPSWNQEFFDTASIVVMGDVIAHNDILRQAQGVAANDGYDFSFLFKNIAPFVQSADIAIVNQEGPLVADERQVNGGSYSFGTPSQMACAYKEAGFNVIALANNHIMDRGLDGFLGTVEVLDRAGLTPTGYQPTIVECNNMRVGILNATYLQVASDLVSESGSELLTTSDGLAISQVDAMQMLSDPSTQEQCRQGVRVQTTVTPSALCADVAALHGETDFVLCYLHVGEEYATEPAEADRELISSLIDAGADAVVCTHPHVVQPVERVVTAQGNTGIVFYSLGNLVSSQTFPGTQDGLAAQFIIVRSREDPHARATILTYQAIPTTCVMTDDETTVFIEK